MSYPCIRLTLALVRKRLMERKLADPKAGKKIFKIPFYTDTYWCEWVASPGLLIRAFKTMGYGLDRSPFFVVGNSMI